MTTPVNPPPASGPKLPGWLFVLLLIAVLGTVTWAIFTFGTGEPV
ncbi:MAG: hypothetical protein AAF628_30320 [Planctomycetota bacterium]